MNNIHLSGHAELRCAQRNVSLNDLGYVLRNGATTYNAGGLFFFLGKRDIPKKDRSYDNLTRLEGTTVIIDSKVFPNRVEVITVYRNRNSQKDIRQKSKYFKD